MQIDRNIWLAIFFRSIKLWNIRRQIKNNIEETVLVLDGRRSKTKPWPYRAITPPTLLRMIRICLDHHTPLRQSVAIGQRYQWSRPSCECVRCASGSCSCVSTSSSVSRTPSGTWDARCASTIRTPGWRTTSVGRSSTSIWCWINWPSKYRISEGVQEN